ncbi:unnamed protein product [Acanthoscelides obtectus]|uniref:Tc1-like transposase DDE domain-containing protein n=1 Tax=Acanthoscelides obtectus TaxID=200917 RepID=A0A9P0M8J1_ACAOB|nr:unnamed protein product [Acanthoscelides obtectus]CAK1626430.1 Histone-lysine N-methyltransferase SETMAR [Acanthoscelides obtectus]
MELNREHFRDMTYYNLQIQLSQQECLRHKAPHQSTISRWYGEFKRGRVSLSDYPRKISKTSIQKILHEELGVRKLVSRWIPHLLTEEQKAARVKWCQKTLDRFNSGNSKNMYSIVNGDESWIYCYEPENKRQSAVWVQHRKINPERRIILHQDNASSHTAQRTRQYLTEESVELLDHPPYSPDLSPNDFFTLPKIKNRLRGQRFQSPEGAVDAFKDAVLDLPANECFENWFERMQMCINLRGEYFEKQ